MNWRFKNVLILGLAGLVWFGVFFQAAHDLWAACVVFLLTTVLISAFAAWSYRKVVPARLPLAPSVLGILCAVWLSLRHAFDTDTALLEAWGWTFAFCLFYLLLNVLDEEGDYDRFLYAGGLAAVPLAILCIWQQCTGHTDSWGHWEIQATLVNSLVLAGFALTWFFLFWQKAWQGHKLALVLLIACFIILCLARSWWAFICLFAGFIFYYRGSLTPFFLRYRRFGAAFGAAVLFLFTVVVTIKIRQHVGPYKGTSRTYYWLAASKIWRQNPWTGAGLGGFATAYPYFRDSRFQSTLFAHSFPVQWLTETGMIGMLALSMFILSVFKAVSRSLMSRPAAWRQSAVQASLFVILLFSLISINLDYLLNKILLLMVLAASLASHKLPAMRVKPLWISVFSLCLWLLSPFWLRMFLGSQSYVKGLSYEREGSLGLARESYEASVSMDPYLADSYNALSRLDWRQLEQDGLPQTRMSAILHAQRAIQCRKDIRFIAELNRHILMPATTKRS